MRDRPAGPADRPPRTTGLVGLIPAAGRGVRAYPYTETIPKSMLEVDGVPLIQRNVELLRDRLGCDEVRIVIGHQGHVIREHLGDGSQHGVRLTYIQNDQLDLELIWSIHLGSRGVERPCAIVLADECYVDTNHDALAALDDGAAVRCGLIDGEYAKQIRKNYVATLDGDRIVDLHEKPAVVTERLMGTGTWVVQPEIFRRLEAALAGDEAQRPRDWVGWLGQLCREGVDVRAFRLSGRYVNVNSRDDLNYANFLVRERTFDQKTTSLVYVVDDQEDAAARPITGFADRAELDEVVAIARRTAPGLEAAAQHPKVRLVVTEPDVNIASLFVRGMDAARGDLILLSYSDDTFSPRDVSKMLVYLRDADLVVGTRTTRQMIEQGANMQGVVRAAHLFLAKLLELLWWRFECRFTDVCCVYRGIWRSTWTTIRGNLTATGVEIVPEMVIEVLRARRRIVEIPVNYYNRDLEFGYVRSRYQSVGTFARIVAMMLRKRLERTG